MQYDLLNILTPFLMKSVENEGVPPKIRFSRWGGSEGGHEKDTKMISIAFKTSKLAKKALFMAPPQTPISKIVFWAALPHFSTDFV